MPFGFIRREWPSALVILAGFLLQIFLVTRPIETVMASVLSDDSFFYYKVAQNILQGYGSTFDLINPANGYHPLWMLVLLPIFYLFGTATGDVAPIYALLSLQVLLNLCTALLVYRILTRFTESPWIRSFGMTLWTLNPFLLYQSVNGLETSLALFFFSLAFLTALRIEEGRQRAGWWIIGALFGLLILSRLDMAFYFLAFLAWIFARHGLAGWRNALQAAVIPGILSAIYAAWNFLNFSMLIPASAKAEVLFSHVLTYQDNGETLGQFLKAIVYFTHYEATAVLRDTGMYALAAALLGIFIALSLRGDIKIPKRFADIDASFALFFGFAALFIADASLRWVGRAWYFVSFDLFVAIVATVVLAKLFPYISYKRTVAAILIGFVALSFYASWSKNLRGEKNPGWNHPDLIVAAEWMNANLPEGSRVGSFTPGIMGYFSRVPVVALDGLINNNSYIAMRDRTLWQNMEDTTTHFVQTGNHLTYSFKSFLGVDDPFSRLSKLKNDPALPNMTFYSLK